MCSDFWSDKNRTVISFGQFVCDKKICVRWLQFDKKSEWYNPTMGPRPAIVTLNQFNKKSDLYSDFSQSCLRQKIAPCVLGITFCLSVISRTRLRGPQPSAVWGLAECECLAGPLLGLSTVREAEELGRCWSLSSWTDATSALTGPWSASIKLWLTSSKICKVILQRKLSNNYILQGKWYV